MEGGKHLFHWLLERDLSDFHPNEIPITAYKKDLKVKQSCSVIRWMIAIYDKLVDADDHTEVKKTHPGWFQAYQEWCIKNNERNVLSASVVGSLMKENGFDLIEIKSKPDPVTKKRISARYRILSTWLLEEKMAQYITKRLDGDASSDDPSGYEIFSQESDDPSDYEIFSQE